MFAGIVIGFVVVFALILLAVSVGLKFFDARRKKQMANMLQTAGGDAVTTITSLLKEITPDKPTGIKALLSAMQFTSHAEELLQQAGLNWTAQRLLSTMAIMAVPGIALGILVPVIMNVVVTAVVSGTVFAVLPYWFVRRKRKKRLDALEEQFPEALDFLSRSMRAGHAFSITLN